MILNPLSKFNSTETSGAGSSASRGAQFYGRRGGYKLRPRRQKLVDELLPTIRLLAEPGQIELSKIFGSEIKENWLEVGFGAGEHLAEQARLNPHVGFIGCEPFLNGVAALLAQIEKYKLGNIRIFDDDARLILPLLPEASIHRCFVLFSDPWPKARHHRRRFIKPNNLNALGRILKDNAELRFASDHMGHVSWALEHTIRHPNFIWPVSSADDWRLAPDDWVQTRYERKALAKGEACAYLSFYRRLRGKNEVIAHPYINGLKP
jgi:tRNA (guanine-N7-)-methyltransferase